MNINSLENFFESLSGDEMALIYSGHFSDEATARVIELSNAQFKEGDQNKLQRKTGFLVAECFQNIVRHNESTIENGYFLTRNENGVLYIASGNIISNEMIPELTDNLKHLNSLSKDELKEIYLQTLSNNEMSEKGGAGLGLIEMARKTGNKLNFDFKPVNESLSYFYFQIKLLTDEGSDASQDHDLAHNIELRNEMLKNDIFLLYQGDVSMNTVLPILDMAENSIASRSNEKKTVKRVYIALMELLQNMSKHGKVLNGNQKGLLLIGERDGRYIIGGSNYIDENNVKILQSKLPLYSQMDMESLQSSYKFVLKHGDLENKNGASLGIIEMARRSSIPMEYSINKHDNKDVVHIKIEI